MNHPPTETESIGPASPQRGKFRWWAMATALALAAYFASPTVRRMMAEPYVVSGGEAVVRQFTSNTNGAALEVDVRVECNARKPIAFTRMTVDSVTDDLGKNLLGGPLKPGLAYSGPAAWIGVLWNDQGGWKHVSAMGSHWQPGSSTERFAWQVGVPHRPSPGAKSVRVIGKIDFRNGGKIRRETVRGLKFETGTKFTMAGVRMEVIGFSPAWKGNSRGSCQLRVSDPKLMIESIDAKAGEFAILNPTRMRIPGWADDSPEDYTISIDTPAGAGSGNVIFTYRTDTRHVVVPVDVNLPIRVMDRSEELTMFGNLPPMTISPEDSEWGIKHLPGRCRRFG